ncbi:MAG: urease accessory protein UreD [Desulfarculus sp.]|nr:urease accessory protein UreD [Desulfarculus sp.]
MSAPPEGEGWHASLELGLRLREGRTVLVHNRHQGPLMVQRPFYPEGEQGCHLYILHPPGGVVAGDMLRVSASLAEGARALLTTPAAGKVYRSHGPQAAVEQTLAVATGAVLEWLPLETIVYDQARAHLRTRVNLAPGAAFLGWEIICLGLPAAGQAFRAGQVRQDLEVWRAGQPLLLERGRYQGGSPVLAAPWGLGGFWVSGTMLATGGGPALLAEVRARVASAGLPGRFAATLVSGLIVCRYLGWEAEAARGCFLRAWEVLRPQVAGQTARPPRVWGQ